MLHVYPYAACLKYQTQINQSAMKKITWLLANDFIFQKRSQRLPETGNSLLVSGTLFITFDTELQDKHWEASFDIFWVTDQEKLLFVSLYLYLPTGTVLLGYTLVH